MREAVFTPTASKSSHGGKLYTKFKVVSSGRLEAVTGGGVLLKCVREVNSFVENVFPGSSLRSTSKLQEETSKGHIFVVIFNISLITFPIPLDLKLVAASHILLCVNRFYA